MSPGTSHEAYASHCAAVAQQLQTNQVRVQVKRRGEVFCGQVLACDRFADARESEWFKVRTPLGAGWFPARAVRLCSGLDGRCTCVEPDGQARAGCTLA